MKMPTVKGWIAIIGAILALFIAVLAALKDGNITPEESKTLTDKAGNLIEAVQEATQEPQEVPTEATP